MSFLARVRSLIPSYSQYYWLTGWPDLAREGNTQKCENWKARVVGRRGVGLWSLATTTVTLSYPALEGSSWALDITKQSLSRTREQGGRHRVAKSTFLRTHRSHLPWVPRSDCPTGG